MNTLRCLFSLALICLSVRAVLAQEENTRYEVDALNGKYVKVWRALLDPKNVSDSYGRRIGRRYIAIQVEVANLNKDYQWLMHDASVSFSDLLLLLENRHNCAENLNLLKTALAGKPAGAGETDLLYPRAAAAKEGHRDLTLRSERQDRLALHTDVSSIDLNILRGVAEKGQIKDPRNLTYRAMQAAGTIAASLIGVMNVGNSFAPGVAAFNGPAISAFQRLFPDYTVNQLNRLNDTAWVANTVVGKQQARTIVLFIPQSYLLTRAQQSAYYKDPQSVFGCVDLRLLSVVVDGNFIATVSSTPVITAVRLDEAKVKLLQGDGGEVPGEIVGRFLEGASVELIDAPQGVTLKSSTGSTDTRLPFTLKSQRPIAPNTILTFQLSKPEIDLKIKSSIPVSYMADPPSIRTVEPSDWKAGEKVAVTIEGSNFLPTGMQILLDPSEGITIGQLEFESSQKIKVEIGLASGVAVGTRNLVVLTTGKSSPAKVTVSK